MSSPSLSLHRPRVPSAPQLEFLLSESDRVLREQGLSPQSRRIYLPKIRHLLTHLGHTPPEKMDPDWLTAYLKKLVAIRKPSPATLAQTLSVLRFFFRHVVYHAQALRLLRERTGVVPAPAAILTREQVLRMLAAGADPRSRAMVGLLFGSGLRLGECRRVRAGDFRNQGRVVVVRDGNHESARATVVSPRTGRDIALLVTGFAAQQLLFPGRGGGVIGSRAVQKLLQQLGNRSGVGPGTTPRVLRRSFARALQQQGVELATVEQLMGLRSPGFTTPPSGVLSPL